MGGKLNVYNLGEQGVDVVKSPLHEADGDLFQAQNALCDPAGLEGGIRKRDGMAKVNALALTGAVEGALHVPLPAPGTRTYYAGQQELGGVPPADTWFSSLGGASGWAGRSTPSLPQAAAYVEAVAAQAQMQGCLTYRRRLFYAAKIVSGNENPVIRMWDGTRDIEIARIPYPPGSVTRAQIIGHMWMHRGILHCVAGIGFEQRVYKVDIVTGAIQRVGNEFTGNAIFGLSYLDRVFIGQDPDAGNGTLSWIRNGEETFTLERTAAAGHSAYMHGAIYLGALFVGTFGDAGTAAIVERRTTAGVWSTSATGTSAAPINYFTCFAVFDGNLYAVYVARGGAPELEVWKFDGSSWTVDLDLIGAGHAGGVHPAGVLAETDALYIAFASPAVADPDGYVMRRTTAGAWSKVATLANGNGMISFLP